VWLTCLSSGRRTGTVLLSLLAVLVVWAAAAAPPKVAAPDSTPPEVRWLPMGVDEVAPEVTPGVSCPLAEVLEGVQGRAKELVESLERISAIERVEHTEINNRGRARVKNEITVEYVAQIREVRPGRLSVEEWRSGGTTQMPAGTRLFSTGLGAFGLIFHPYYVDDVEVRCEGLGRWRDQPAWQLYFRQREDREPRLRGYRVKQGSATVPLKGRAWVDTNNYQILRLETELLKPLPGISLEHEQFLIDYQPVRFPASNAELWLPQTAELYIQYQGRRYRHRHSFSNYKLFSVEVEQRIQPPAEPDPEP